MDSPLLVDSLYPGVIDIKEVGISQVLAHGPLKIALSLPDDLWYDAYWLVM